jgi:hypothetical protein
MENRMSERSGSSGDLSAPFIFVPTGAPEPTEWMAAHPHWIKIPATLVPRGSASSRSTVPPGTEPAAIAGTAVAVAPGIAEGMGAGFLGGIGELIAPLAAPLAALGILLYPSRTVSREQEQELLHPGGEGFDPPPATPPLPGLVPPVTGDSRPGEGGFAPPPPSPPLPGFTPAPPSPNLLPGRPADEQGALILRQDRNEGLMGGARANSGRSRAAARAADPEVTRALPDADWRAHHLINVAALRAAPELIAAAVRAGWRTDDPTNVVALPASPGAQQKLKAATDIDRPVHNSGHQNWNTEVEERLRTIERELPNQGVRPGTDAYGQQARKALEKLQNDLRQKMMPQDRLTENGLVSHTASV